MNDPFLDLVQQIYDGDMLVARLRHMKDEGLGDRREITEEIRELEASLSLMRAYRQRHERTELAHILGVHQPFPDYDGAGITAPLGEAIRRRAEELGA